ncbi:MAG: hypothetical protein GC162_19505 [Planctomycetes bacterium]|nr:hypothetical protein [Planctomycetota bacterium]
MDDLLTQIDHWIEGTLGDADRSVLERAIRTDDAAADAFARLSLIHSLLVDQAIEQAALQANILPEKPRIAGRVDRHAGRWIGGLIAACVAIGLGVLWNHASTGQPGERIALMSPGGGSGGGVAVLTSAEDASFIGTDANVTPGSELEPGMLRLASGSAQVMFKSTAVVDLTGPAAFELTGVNAGYLRHGQIEAYVPERAHGFTINGSTFSVVDMGTAFKMRIDADGRGEIYVTSGWVQLRPAATGSDIVLLHAGEGSMIDAGGKVIAVVEDDLKERAIYREAFGNPTRVDQPLASTGWHIDKSGGVASELQTLSYAPHASEPPIASSPANDVVTDAFMLTMDPESDVDYLVWTDEMTIDPQLWRVIHVRWSERHDVPAQASRLAMRIGGQWYVSQTLIPPAEADDTGFRRQSVDVTKATWSKMTLERGKALAIAGAAVPPTGMITGLGVYVEHRRGFKLRYDSFEIDAAPTLLGAYEQSRQ